MIEKRGLASDVGVGALAVVFTSLRMPGTRATFRPPRKWLARRPRSPGLLGVDSARGEDGVGVTVSYRTDAAAIRRWQFLPTGAPAHSIRP